MHTNILTYSASDSCLKQNTFALCCPLYKCVYIQLSLFRNIECTFDDCVSTNVELCVVLHQLATPSQVNDISKTRFPFRHDPESELPDGSQNASICLFCDENWKLNGTLNFLLGLHHESYEVLESALSVILSWSVLNLWSYEMGSQIKNTSGFSLCSTSEQYLSYNGVGSGRGHI